MADILIGLSVGVPLLGALAIRLAGDRRGLARCMLAIACLGATGLSALLLLFLPLEGTSYVTKSLAFFGVLAAAIGGLALAGKFIVDSRHGQVHDSRTYTWWLVLLGALLGISLLKNMLLLYFSWCLLAFSGYRLLFPDDLVEAIQEDIQEHRERHRYDIYG